MKFMRVLIVANYNSGSFSPFISEQVEAIRQLGVEIEYFGVKGKGVGGYLSNLKPLKKKIRSFRPDLVHAHYGLSGLLANLQRKVPVITTYHGSDIHSEGLNLFLARITIRLSAFNIFVSEGLQKLSGFHGKKQCILPCGVDFNNFSPMNRQEARKLLGWDIDGKYILFAGSFDSEVKNSPLAKAAVAKIKGAQLVEMNEYSREQVNLAMNAANCLLMTSHREGSPQVVKEAMACGTPIVSVNVGDVAEKISGIEGCYLTSYDVNDIVKHLHQALSIEGKVLSRERIFQRQLTNDVIAKRLLSIYQEVLS